VQLEGAADHRMRYPNGRRDLRVGASGRIGVAPPQSLQGIPRGEYRLHPSPANRGGRCEVTSYALGARTEKYSADAGQIAYVHSGPDQSNTAIASPVERTDNASTRLSFAALGDSSKRQRHGFSGKGATTRATVKAIPQRVPRLQRAKALRSLSAHVGMGRMRFPHQQAKHRKNQNAPL
jgi:hypothetical protein